MSEGCQIILVNARNEILLQLRDEKDSIPFPGMWALPGGMLEPGETPLECIGREVAEEMGVVLPTEAIEHVESAERSYGIEHTFTARCDVPAEEITLTEGQRVAWFTRAEVESQRLAYEDNAVLGEFFAQRSR